MTAVMDLRIRTSKREPDFKYSTLSFPETSDRLSDQIIEQMMMDGFVTSTIRNIYSVQKIHLQVLINLQFCQRKPAILWRVLITVLESQHLANSSVVMDKGHDMFCTSG